MSDNELDRDWKPTGRPQSTMARSFSAALNDVFKIDNSLADLDAAVDQKKKAVSSQTSELEALEARLRATEERLKQRQATNGQPPHGAHSPRQRAPLGDMFTSPAQGADAAGSARPLSNEYMQKTSTRPPASKRQEPPTMSIPLSSNLTPTPSFSEGGPTDEVEIGTRIPSDYVIVGKDGDFPQPQPSQRLDPPAS